MANRIKGITIEIDGNTTKLDKALQNTDNQLKKTQAGLKEVNKLLKMDPGNTEALVQKQRLLADAVSGTKERYETLKKAAEDSDAALARGKEYAAKYGQLENELAEVAAKYEKAKEKKKELDKQLELGAITSETYTKEAAEVEKLRITYKDLSTQVSDAKKEMGGPMLNQDQYDIMHRQLMTAKIDYENAEKAAKSFNVSAAEIQAVADKVSGGAKKISDATRGISAAAGVAAAGLVGMAAKAGLAADDLNTMAKQSGFSTQFLQEFSYASDLIDVSLESVVSAAQKMKKNMVSTSSDVQAAWQRLGMSVYDSSGQLRDVDGVFYDLIGNLSLIENETERDTLAMTLLGRGADELAGIIDDGGAAFRELAKEAQDMGFVLSQDALDGANAFNDGLDRIKAQASAAFMEAGASLAENLLPVMEEAVAGIGDLLKWLGSLDGSTLKMLLSVLLAVAGISPVAGMISNIAGGLSSIVGLVGTISGALGGLGGAAGAASSAVGGIASAAGGLTGAIGGALEAVGALFLGPVGIVAGAAAAAIGLTILWDTNEDFRNSMEAFDQWITGVFTTDWSESFGAAGEVLNAFFANAQNFYESFKTILGGIIDFIGGVFSGDWERAWQGVTNIFQGLLDLWGSAIQAPFNLISGAFDALSESIKNVLINLINFIGGTFFDDWDESWTNNVEAMEAIWGTVEDVIKAPINGAIGLINSFLQFVTDGLNSLISLLNSFQVDVPDWVPGIGGQSYGFNLGTLTAPSIPYLADGGLARRNNPFLAVVGDNPTQDEIISPYSTIVDAVREAVSGLGGSGGVQTINMTVNGDLAALFRLFRIGIQTEDARLGPSQAKT